MYFTCWKQWCLHHMRVRPVHNLSRAGSRKLTSLYGLGQKEQQSGPGQFNPSLHLCPVFETRVIRRISSYPWSKKQQCFSNSKSRVILGITRPKLPRHYRWDKLGINSGKQNGHWLRRRWWRFVVIGWVIHWLVPTKASCQPVNRFGWSLVLHTI